MRIRKVFMLASCIALFVACEKDELIVEKNTHRIKEILEERPSVSSADKKTVYSYNNEKIVKVEILYQFNQGWELESFDSIEYSGNKISVFHYYGPDYIYLSSKEEFLIERNKVTQAIFFNYYESFEPEYKVEYKYSGEVIEEAQYWKMHMEEWELFKKVEINYINNVISECLSYSLFSDQVFKPTDKQTFSEEDGRITGWVDYDWEDENLILSQKFEYVYFGELINEAVLYEYIESNWEYDLTYYYEYNENSNLEKEDLGIIKRNYIYEEGNGNYDLVVVDPVFERYNLPRTKKGQFEGFKIYNLD